MTRVWLLFFMTSLSVAFLLYRPTDTVTMPWSKEFHEIPADVFFYHSFEHLISIIKALIFISAIFWPIERRFIWAYVAFLVIEIVDFGLFRMYYRGWFSDDVPWNVVKTLIMGVITEIYQFSEWSRK
jgi:hypothetical protein